MSAIRLFLLLNVVLANAEVILHDVGKSTVIVEDDELHVVVTDYEKCDGDLDIHYAVTEVSSAVFAVSGEDKLCRMRTPNDALQSTGYNANSKCPLAKFNENRLNINTVSPPKNCVVTLRNSELPSAAAKTAQDDSLHTAVIVGSVLGALILVALAIVIAVFVWCVPRPWWTRRQEPGRATRRRTRFSVQNSRSGEVSESEFGYLVRLQEHLPERERDCRCYSIQLLLLIALNQANTERIRREAFAFMMVKIARQLPKYATSQLEGMAFPMSLVPEVTKQNPEIFQHPEKFQTGWKDTEGCCEKKGTAETASTPAPAPTTQQERQLDKKPSVTTATTKTSVTEEK